MGRISKLRIQANTTKMDNFLFRLIHLVPLSIDKMPTKLRFKILEQKCSNVLLKLIRHLTHHFSLVKPLKPLPSKQARSLTRFSQAQKGFEWKACPQCVNIEYCATTRQ